MLALIDSKLGWNCDIGLSSKSFFNTDLTMCKFVLLGFLFFLFFDILNLA